MSQSPTPVRLAVLNPGGRDPFVDYADGPGVITPGVHAPINFHAYAAATRGAFFDSTEAVLKAGPRFTAVLVLIRRRVWISLQAVRRLKAAGHTVLVAWKECGPYQITEQLRSSRVLESYQEILSLADGILSPTVAPPPRWGWMTAGDFDRKCRFIPTPYPIEFPDWDFSVPVAERHGILVGTREFSVPTRNHLRALAMVASLSDRLKTRVTVINGGKSRDRRILSQLEESFPEGSIDIVERPLPYADYLRLMARHRLVFQLDRSSVPGQVAGDALLCRVLCAGGNSAMEKIAFPDFSDDGSGDLDVVRDRIAAVFADESAYAAEVEASQRLAREKAGYEPVARALADFVAAVSGTAV